MKVNFAYSMLILLAFALISSAYAVNYPYEDTSTNSNFKQVKQTHIALDLFVDFDRRAFLGSVKITFDVIERINTIHLDTNRLTIYKIEEGNSTTDVKQSDYKIDNNPDSKIGQKLSIKLSRFFQRGEKVVLVIYYRTNVGEQTSVVWNTDAQTKGNGKAVFTNSEPIYTRAVVPCQDTPAVKAKVYARLTVADKEDVVALFGGVKDKDPIANPDKTTTYTYKQNIPIASYLIAIAVGRFKRQAIEESADKIKVYAWCYENIATDVIATFKNKMTAYIDNAQKYLFGYDWGEYNLLVLPASFMYGGMENPNLTFVTPSIIDPDQSQTFVAAHELAHSWTGNLVTNYNWDNLWMNESFTVFLERKLIQLTDGKDGSAKDGNDRRKLASEMGRISLKADMKDMTEKGFGRYTSVYHQSHSDNPDDAFSLVVYEKGYNILYRLEQLVGEENFQTILLAYLKPRIYSSVTGDDFISTFNQQLVTLYPDETERKKITDQVDFDTWINSVYGDPKEAWLDHNDYSKYLY